MARIWTERGIAVFEFLKKKPIEKKMLACADGKVIPMSEATDDVFSSCALGDGVVICPTGNVVVAPADGKVTVTMEASNHAIGMVLDNGIEVLLHIGVNTVELNGKGFRALVKKGDTIKAGKALIQFDREAMEQAGYCMEIMQIVTEGESELPAIRYTTGMTAKAGETVVAEW